MSRVPRILVACLLLFGASAQAENRPSCYCNSTFREVGNLRDYFINVADYYEAPPRVAVSSLSLSEQERYKPTGKLMCNGYVGSAQLTVKNNLITTVGHILKSDKDCSKRSNATDCTFYIESGGRIRPVKVASLVASGFEKCPVIPGEADDWAVMKLSESVDDVEPYPVDLMRARRLQENDRVATVAQSGDFWATINGKKEQVKHFSECSVIEISGNIAVTTGIATACGCSHGCSGGSLLSTGPNPVLLGIIATNNESQTAFLREKRLKRPDVLHYQKGENGNGTAYVTINKEIMAALEKGSQ